MAATGLLVVDLPVIATCTLHDRELNVDCRPHNSTHKEPVFESGQHGACQSGASH